MNRARAVVSWALLGGAAGCILLFSLTTGLEHDTLLMFLAAGCFVAAFLLRFEGRFPSARELMPVMVMVALGSVGRVLFAFLPQVQPVTTLVLCAGVSLGPVSGFVTGALCAVVSNLAMGMGPWTLWQMLGWGVIGLLGGGLTRLRFTKKWQLCTAAFFSGFLYGWIVDVWTVIFYGEGLTLKMFLSVYAAGMLFNLIHAIGNAVFALLLYPLVCKKLDRVRKKYGIKRN